MEHPLFAVVAVAGQTGPVSVQTALGTAELAKELAAAPVIDSLHMPAVLGSAVAKRAVADPARATEGHSEHALGLAPARAGADPAMGPLAGSVLATSPARGLKAPVTACLALHTSEGGHTVRPGPRAADAETAPEAAVAAARTAGVALGLAAAAPMLLGVGFEPGLAPDQRSATVPAQH